DAARIEKAVLLGRLERRHRPWLPFDRHDVDVCEQEQRPLLAGPGDAGDQVSTPRRRLEDLRANARLLEAGKHRLQRRRLVAGARIDAQDLVEDLAGFGFDGGGCERDAGEREKHLSPPVGRAPYHAPPRVALLSIGSVACEAGYCRPRGSWQSLVESRSRAFGTWRVVGLTQYYL